MVWPKIRAFLPGGARRRCAVKFVSERRPGFAGKASDLLCLVHSLAERADSITQVGVFALGQSPRWRVSFRSAATVLVGVLHFTQDNESSAAHTGILLIRLIRTSDKLICKPAVESSVES